MFNIVQSNNNKRGVNVKMMCEYLRHFGHNIANNVVSFLGTQTIHKITLLPNFLFLILNIAKVVIGLSYWDRCDTYILHFLLIAGGTSCICIFTYISLKLLCINCDEPEFLKCCPCTLLHLHISLLISAAILHLSLNLIWGSIIVFDDYTYWNGPIYKYIL